MGITTIVRDVDSDDEAEVRKKRKPRVIDRGSVNDYEGILGVFNQQTGQWEGFSEDTSYPTMQDLQMSITQVKQQARLEREEVLREKLGLPPSDF